MGKITINTEMGKQQVANKELLTAKVDAAIAQLTAYIDNPAPTNTETLEQVRFQAQLLKKILNFLRH